MNDDCPVTDWNASAPTCDWFAGCTMLATTAGLCPFHFDACERPDLAAMQLEHENRRCTADCCADDEEAAA